MYTVKNDFFFLALEALLGRVHMGWKLAEISMYSRNRWLASFKRACWKISIQWLQVLTSVFLLPYGIFSRSWSCDVSVTIHLGPPSFVFISDWFIFANIISWAIALILSMIGGAFPLDYKALSFRVKIIIDLIIIFTFCYTNVSYLYFRIPMVLYRKIA